MKLTPAPPPPDFRSSLAVSYDAAAGRRDEMGEAGWRRPIAERFHQLMVAEGKGTFLEIGAGVGYTSQWFAAHGATVTAIDLSPAQAELCRAKGLDAHVRDMYELGFRRRSFDAAWAMNCVHHVPSADFPAVLAGIADVLAPGGLFYLGVWGGVDDEGIYEDDFYPPPRFFCMRSDDTLRREVEAVFTVETFDTFVPDIHEHDGDERHMQSLILRRP